MGDPRTPRRPPPFATSVVAATTPGRTPSVGTKDRVAREDHDHGTPSVSAYGYSVANLSAQCNGIADVFTTPTNYLAGSLIVLVNGLDQGVTGVHFTELSANTFRVAGPWVLPGGTSLVVRYVAEVGP